MWTRVSGRTLAEKARGKMLFHNVDSQPRIKHLLTALCNAWNVDSLIPSLAAYHLNQWLRHHEILHMLHSCFSYPPLFLVITISDVISSGNQSYFAFLLEMGWPFLSGSFFHNWKGFYIRPILHRKNMWIGWHQKSAALHNGPAVN